MKLFLMMVCLLVLTVNAFAVEAKKAVPVEQGDRISDCIAKTAPLCDAKCQDNSIDIPGCKKACLEDYSNQCQGAGG